MRCGGELGWCVMRCGGESGWCVMRCGGELGWCAMRCGELVVCGHFDEEEGVGDVPLPYDDLVVQKVFLFKNRTDRLWKL